MMRLLVLIVVVFGFTAEAAAQEKVVGLLALPQVFGPRQCAPFEPTEVALHGSPNDGHPFAFIRVDQNWSFAPHGGCEGLEVRVHAATAKHELPTREFDYEMPGAIVVDHRDGWFKIKLHDRSAWLKASLSDQFLPLAQLFDEFAGLTEINSFTGRLLSSPNAAARGPIMPAVKPQQPVIVREVRGEWVYLDLMSSSPCTAGNEGPPEVVATGWLPLHKADGEPTVWFSSRGC